MHESCERDCGTCATATALLTIICITIASTIVILVKAG